MEPHATSGWADGSGDVDGVTVRHRSHGDDPPIVFVHGVWVGGSLWDEVVPHLPGYRLEADFPDATLEVIPAAGAFVMLDQPAAITAFLTPQTRHRPPRTADRSAQR